MKGGGSRDNEGDLGYGYVLWKDNPGNDGRPRGAEKLLVLLRNICAPLAPKTMVKRMEHIFV